LDEAALARIRAAAKHTSFPPLGRPTADASSRRSSVPTEAMRAERRQREASAHERRQFEAYDPRRWGGEAPWTAEEVGDIPAEYFDYKRRMERAGASAEEDDVPARLRRFSYSSLQELRAIEEAGALPRPQTPRRGEDKPETDYPFLRRLPPGVVGARITLRHSREQRRIVGWCAHPCTVPHRDAVCGGDGRCLRPVVLGVGGSHGAAGSHKCPRCEGLSGRGRR